jgi:hypothetical protein
VCVEESVDTTDSGEDAASQADHTAVMKAELAKQRPNMAVVDERKNRTLAQRRTLIESSTVDVVLEHFPGLGYEEQVKPLHLLFCTFCLQWREHKDGIRVTFQVCCS